MYVIFSGWSVFVFLRLFLRLLEKGWGFFAYNWKLPAYSGAFLLTFDLSGTGDSQRDSRESIHANHS